MAFEFTDGTTLMVRSCILSGCNFYAGYPISPASKFHLLMMTEMAQMGRIAIQGEDEIASISMAIGASLSGKKALTASSGPGLSLYSESIGFALMAEVPLVIVIIQRMGPATGGATTNLEADVQFARWVTSGGLPMVVLCPGSPESIFGLMNHAFNVSETLRTPVIFLTSKEMALSKERIDSRKLLLGKIHDRKEFQGNRSRGKKYIPFNIDKLSDIPDFLPLGANQLVRYTSSMHDEKGLLTRDPQKVKKKLVHLEKKILVNKKIIDRYLPDLDAGAKILIIGYGTLSRICQEVSRRIRSGGRKCSLLTIESLFPLPETALKKALRGVESVVLPELNSGLYAESVKPFLKEGQKIISITRVDGSQLDAGEILSRIRSR